MKILLEQNFLITKNDFLFNLEKLHKLVFVFYRNTKGRKRTADATLPAVSAPLLTTMLESGNWSIIVAARAAQQREMETLK